MIYNHNITMRNNIENYVTNYFAAVKTPDLFKNDMKLLSSYAFSQYEIYDSSLKRNITKMFYDKDLELSEPVLHRIEQIINKNYFLIVQNYGEIYLTRLNHHMDVYLKFDISIADGFYPYYNIISYSSMETTCAEINQEVNSLALMNHVDFH